MGKVVQLDIDCQITKNRWDIMLLNILVKKGHSSVELRFPTVQYPNVGENAMVSSTFCISANHKVSLESIWRLSQSPDCHQHKGSPVVFSAGELFDSPFKVFNSLDLSSADVDHLLQAIVDLEVAAVNEIDFEPKVILLPSWFGLGELERIYQMLPSIYWNHLFEQVRSAQRAVAWEQEQNAILTDALLAVKTEYKKELEWLNTELKDVKQFYQTVYEQQPTWYKKLGAIIRRM